jgi:hypothetical protein
MLVPWSVTPAAHGAEAGRMDGGGGEACGSTVHDEQSHNAEEDAGRVPVGQHPA